MCYFSRAKTQFEYLENLSTDSSTLRIQPIKSNKAALSLRKGLRASTAFSLSVIKVEHTMHKKLFPTNVCSVLFGYSNSPLLFSDFFRYYATGTQL